MTARFLGTVSAMLVITATLAYNSHVSWRVYFQELCNVQAPLNARMFEDLAPPEPLGPIPPVVAGDV